MLVKKLLLALAFFVALVSYGRAGEIGQKCPAVDVGNNIFSASALVKGARIAVEKAEGNYPIVLGLYRPAVKGCERIEFARYSVEGSAPNVDSLFFMKIRGRINVFAIVSWAINNRGDETYGNLYQVYAYQIESNGRVSENKLITENEFMTGIEGYYGGRQSIFSYKTAAEVKKFWRGDLK